MSNQEILEKAIRKAIDGGWTPGWQDRRPVVRWGAEYSEDYDEGEGVMISGYHAKSNASIWFFPLNTLIFNHDFAKALWGEEDIEVFTGFGYEEGLTEDDPGDEYNTYDYHVAWQYHLQQMVIADDPIAYLGENI